jgi:hypothetical protein
LEKSLALVSVAGSARFEQRYLLTELRELIRRQELILVSQIRSPHLFFLEVLTTHSYINVGVA